MRKRDILFLIYQNRSGSTFLANSLSRHPYLAVAPEGHGPLERLIRSAGSQASLPERIERILSGLVSDPKLRAWNVDPSAFQVRADGSLDEIDAFYALCDAFADAHFPDARTVVVKGHFFQKLIAQKGFPELQRERSAKAVFLFRDPRAMFASQRRSLSSRNNKPMQDNPVVAGLRWRQAANAEEKLSAHPHAISVKYEDLILENQRTMDMLSRLLGMPSSSFSEQKGQDSPLLSDLIPAEQQHLHANIGKKPLTARIDSWKDELTQREAAIVELFAGNAMKRMGYEPSRSYALGPADYGAILSLSVSAASRLPRWSRYRNG